MDIQKRRGCLNVEHGKAARLDYIASLTGHCQPNQFAGVVAVEVLYTPDRAILQPDAFQAYLAMLSTESWPTLEALASTALEDLNNELVPRWIMINAEHIMPKNAPNPQVGGHRVMLEDRRPKWDNPSLLARLRPF